VSEIRDSVPDAVVVGAGPNGLAAAITLAREGHTVQVLERAAEVGGGSRSAELTLPGFVHDVCSAIHPFGRTSPFFREAELERFGLRWIEPPAALAHPLDDGSAVIVTRDIDATARQLGADRDAYRRLIGPIVRSFDSLLPDMLAPFHIPLRPRRALSLAWFGLNALQPATWVARRFRDERARALFAGVAAHSVLRLDELVSSAAAIGLIAAAHHDGWPFPAGGAGAIPKAMTAALEDLGGSIRTDRPVDRLEDLPPSRLALFDTSPGTLQRVAGKRLPDAYREKLRNVRYGPSVFKVDVALDGPIPWLNPDVGLAGTVHLGGTFHDIDASEAAAASGEVHPKPFVLLAQPSLFDRSRAPEGKHTVWAYCHVPHASTVDASEAIVGQIERYAPGFRERVLAIRKTSPAELEAYNPNDVGGDISGGRLDLRQLFTRPVARLDPYSTPDPRLFLCSSSTPPGGGIHGMCGWHAAHSAVRRLDARRA
jgi:phytoene dehydrogenase-like protein